VVQFYIARLGDEWEHCEEDIPVRSDSGESDDVTHAFFVRDDGAGVGLITDGLGRLTRSDTFEVGIDHDASKNSCTGVELK
jgi:hypothetical protein